MLEKNAGKSLFAKSSYTSLDYLEILLKNAMAHESSLVPINLRTVEFC